MDIRFPEMFKNLKPFESLIGLMEIGHTKVQIPFSGALIEYAVILFKKQKEQKEPKKEIHRSSGDIIIPTLIHVQISELQNFTNRKN